MLQRGKITEESEVESRIPKSSILSCRVLSGGRGAVQWTTISFFLHHDYTDDICLLSHRVMVVGQMTLKKINANKTKVLSLTFHRTLPICVNELSIQGIDQFASLASEISVDGGTDLDFPPIKPHFSKIRRFRTLASPVF